MKFEIKDRKKNALMKREEVRVSIDHSGKPTPNRKHTMDEIAKLLKTRPENLIVTKITTPGGSTLSDARVYSYSKKDDIPEWKAKKFTERMAKLKSSDGGAKSEAKPTLKGIPQGAQAGEEPKPTEASAEEKPEGEAKIEESPSEEPKKEEPNPADEKPEEKKEESKKD